MVQDQKIQELEDEVKLLKNEIKHVLTDIEDTSPTYCSAQVC